MGFYIRKSISAGPFRFNLSGSGLGLSVGVKGFRVGTGPRGNYVHMGRGGLYYRASLGGPRRAAKRVSSHARAPTPDAQLRNTVAPPLVDVESGDVLEMRPASGSDIVEQINHKLATVRFWPIAVSIGLAVSLMAYSRVDTEKFSLALLLVTFIVSACVAYLDRLRKTVVVMYDIDDESISPFKHFVEHFDELKAQCIWNIDASGDVTDWKRNAGAKRLLTRHRATLAHSVPSVLKTNIDIPAILGGRQRVYFFPDVVLIVEGSRAGALSYDQVDLSWKTTVFIEDESVPSDSKVVGHTWKFVNKKGGPDRRFNNNRQLPEVMYLQMSLSGPAGLRKMLQFSRIVNHEAFDSALDALRNLIERLTATPATLTQSVVKSIPPPIYGDHLAMSDEAERIEREKPKFWEYKLTVELLRLWVCPLIAKWQELKSGRYANPKKVVPQDYASRWSQDRLSEMSKCCETFTQVINRELSASWGPPGQPGSAENIKEVCRHIAQLAQNLLAWEECVRFATLPYAFEEVRSLLSGCAGLLLDQVAKAYDELSRVFSQEHPSGTYKFSLTVALPKGWNDRFEAALAKASRSVTS